ncbi:hypothetical protein [Kribbella sp. NPDC023855]|uniref:hypothetical protein n=1 Tax=Kribbella sp. NPDC023855 TaxID=3154698 RepID=UPI0033F3EEA7
MATHPASAAAAQVRRRLGLVRQAQQILERAIERSAPPEKLANCRKNLADAQRALAKAKVSAATNAEARPRSRKADTTAKAPAGKAARKRKRETKHATPAERTYAKSDGALPVDTGVRYSQDPDAAKRTVWIFKSGTSFHRRDCQIVESRDGAIEIPVANARKRNLVRCMHCVPTVR